MSQEIETGTETAFCVENWNKNAFNFHQSEDSLELIVINNLDGIDRSVQYDVGFFRFFFKVVKASSQLNGQTNCHLSLCFQSNFIKTETLF